MKSTFVFAMLLSLSLSTMAAEPAAQVSPNGLNCDFTSTETGEINVQMNQNTVGANTFFSKTTANVRALVSTKADLSSAYLSFTDAKTNETLASTFSGKMKKVTGTGSEIILYAKAFDFVYTITCSVN